SGYLFLEFDSNKEGLTNMEIFNTAGQLMKKYAIKITKGYNQFKITVSDIRQGMYLLRVNNSEINITRRFVIAR
ncbi:MAG TPA: T9SS type A sorting domain-containing protein, partial [Chitinophagaceae bacterium]